MLNGRRELITDVRKPEIMVMTSLQAESYLLITPIPHRLVTKLALDQQAPDATKTAFSVGGLPYRKQRLELFSQEKSGRCGNAQQIRAQLYLIDRGDIRQAIDRYAIWASLPGAGYGQFEHKDDNLVQNSKKRAERSERLMYEQSPPRLSRSGYLHHRLPVMGC